MVSHQRCGLIRTGLILFSDVSLCWKVGISPYRLYGNTAFLEPLETLLPSNTSLLCDIYRLGRIFSRFHPLLDIELHQGWPIRIKWIRDIRVVIRHLVMTSN